MTITDKNIEDVTVSELRDDFIQSCGGRLSKDGVIVVGDTYIPLSFRDLSELGLLYKINKEVLHPLGIALTRTTLGGLSMGACVAKDGKPIVYDDKIIAKREVDLGYLPDRLQALRNAYNAPEAKSATDHQLHPEIRTPEQTEKIREIAELAAACAAQPKAPAPLVDRINKEGINFDRFKLFYNLTNKLSITNANNICVSNTQAKSEGRHHKFNSRLPRNLNDLTNFIAYMVYVFDEYFDFITFEGIDATGKQTISNILQDYLNELRDIKNLLVSAATGKSPYVVKYNSEFNDVEFKEINPSAPLNISTYKQNIPDYTIESGKEILRILQTKPEITTLKYLFAVNRLEVQNRYMESACIADSKCVRIYDRYVESSIAFTLAKELIKNDYVPNHIYSYPLGDKIGDCMIDRNRLERDTVQNIENLEYNQFKLIKPKLMILCYTPMNVIQERLQERSKHAPLDKHETDTRLLNTTQFVYHKLANTRKDNKVHDVIKIDTSSASPEDCVVYILQCILDLSFKKILGLGN